MVPDDSVRLHLADLLLCIHPRTCGVKGRRGDLRGGDLPLLWRLLPRRADPLTVGGGHDLPRRDGSRPRGPSRDRYLSRRDLVPDGETYSWTRGGHSGHLLRVLWRPLPALRASGLGTGHRSGDSAHVLVRHHAASPRALPERRLDPGWLR